LLKLNPPHSTFTRRHLKAAQNLRHDLNQIYSTRLGGSRTLLTEKLVPIRCGWLITAADALLSGKKEKKTRHANQYVRV
jgi:hypothetical protein